MENFTSLRVLESWWWQGLAELFTSATWARLHSTTGDQCLCDIPSKLTSFPGFRAMYLTDIRSDQLSSENVCPQHPKTHPHSFSSFETPLAADVATEFADRSHSGLQLSINQLARSFNMAQTTPLITKQSPASLTKLETQGAEPYSSIRTSSCPCYEGHKLGKQRLQVGRGTLIGLPKWLSRALTTKKQSQVTGSGAATMSEHLC